MKLSGKGRTKVIVVGIVVILAVSVVVSYYLVDRPVEIEVDEGKAEESVAYLREDEPGKRLDLIETAETEVEDYGHLSFQVELKSVLEWSHAQEISLGLKASGDFDEELDLETFKFTAVETEENDGVLNHIDFMTSYSDIDNGDIWPPSENLGGVVSSDPDHPAYIGYDLHSNDFEVENEISWEIPKENIGEDFTLELQAVVDGKISEKIVSTVLIHIEEPYTVFKILGEDGGEYGYPTELDVGEYGTISASVKNREHEQMNYTLVVGLGEKYGDMEMKGELPADYNFTFSSNETGYRTNLSLDHEEVWNQSMSFSIEEAGEYRLSFFLLRDGEVYRQLHIRVEVG